MRCLILFSLYTNDLLKKYKNRVIKTCSQRGFEFKKKSVIYKEKLHFLRKI